MTKHSWNIVNFNECKMAHFGLFAASFLFEEERVLLVLFIVANTG